MGLGLASVDMSLGLPEVPPTPASRSDIGQQEPPTGHKQQGTASRCPGHATCSQWGHLWDVHCTRPVTTISASVTQGHTGARGSRACPRVSGQETLFLVLVNSD